MECRDQLPTLSQLKVKILEEEHRGGDKGQGKDNGTEQIFAAKGTQSSKKTDNDQRRNGKCFACGERGHIRAQRKNRMNETNTAMSANDWKSGIGNNSWILDSRAALPMFDR